MNPKVKKSSSRVAPKAMPQDPLHGITLANLLEKLVEIYGWSELGKQIPIKCFTNDPSISSSLKFLRKTPWARTKVEQLYINTLLRNAKYQSMEEQ